MRLKQISFAITLAFISLECLAQNELHFSHLGIEEGFTNSRANSIIQDKKGFIWVGTWNGLNRYDGYNCEVYQPNFHDTTAISNREIVDLLEDSDGNIWIGTSNGLNCFNPTSGKITIYNFKHRILTLCEDREKNIWIGTWYGGLHKLTPSTGKIKNYLPNDIVSDIFIDSRNILWVATYYGLVKFNQKTEDYQRFLSNPDKNSLSNATVTGITESADGNLWVGTWGGGLNRVEVLDQGSRLIFTHFMSETTQNRLADNIISKLYYDQFNNLWIGTWSNGLYRLTEKQQQAAPAKALFTNYHEEQDNPSGIAGDRISALMVDKTGILWVGGADIACASIHQTGVNYYRLPFNHLYPNYKPTSSAIAGYQNHIWVSNNHQIAQYKLNEGKYKLIKTYNPTVIANGETFNNAVILNLTADSSGLWVGTDDAGLAYYPYTNDMQLDSDQASFYNQSTKKASLPGDKITCLFKSKKYRNVIWVGTMQNGFAKLVVKNGTAVASEAYYNGEGSTYTSDNNIRCLYEDSEGLLWVGTQKGLNRFNPIEQKFEKFYYSPSDTTSLNDNIINAIYEDSFGNMWVGTNTGLNKIIEKDNNNGLKTISFKGYPNIKYLKNEIVTNILEDQSQNLWVRTNRGLLKFNIQNEIISGTFFSKDFENNRLNRNTTFKNTENAIVIADLNRFLTFNPNSRNQDTATPNVVITDFAILNKSINGYLADKPTLIPYADNVNITYKDKMLTFVFSAMDYKNTKKNEYSYKLEGFDDQWNYIGSRNSATYTNIPHGQYIFKVKAKNSDGIWSKNETRLYITIAPPWWKTTWAYLLYTLIILGLIHFFNKYSIIKEKEKHKLKFEKLKREEIARLDEMKSLFFTDITHEFKTPLTLIFGPANELAADKKMSKYALKQVELITNNAKKLLRLVNQLMEFRKIEKGIIDELQAEQCDIGLILEEVYNSFKPLSDTRKIKLSLNIIQKPLNAFVDPDKIEKVLFNLVSNAFKYSKDNSAITITANLQASDQADKKIVIRIKDEGIGISDEHKQKIFERFYQVNQLKTQSTGGIGLFLAKTLIEQHNGQIQVESEPEKGSCFTVEIPVNPLLKKEKQKKEIAITNLNSESKYDLSMDSDTDRNSEPQDDTKPIILIVEDDSDLNDFLRMGLSSDYQTISSSNGKEALEKTQELIPDLILSDIMMPEMDGFEFCQAVRKNMGTSHIPIIFLTAKTMQEDEIMGLKLGAVDYIYKPFNLVSVKLKIHNILTNKKILHKKFRTESILKPEDIELSSLDDLFLKEAVESVNQNLDDPSFDVEAFSRELKVSPNQAYRKIKALTGQTAKEFIRNQRLKTAANLLLQRKRTISEVIYMVGFTSPSYFSRCFKELYGYTPSEYMEQQNSEGN
ncbi:hybrid sensor histidine kinase/response regulator transcription factor [Geofilum sp. OHC36d9]|uniref:hybrid sensor histidine kinase/response regulator transcription factor n=1 Tax=Geofilum sp. OHC36d9 TaxID=3458413 RepID=UPI004033E1BB